MPKVDECLRQAIRKLSLVRFYGVKYVSAGAYREDGEVGIDSPQLSAQLLLCYCLKMTREQLITHPEMPVSAAVLSRFQGLIRRREEGEPLAYLLGEREFFGRNFYVSPATLIPRPESETLIEAALKILPDTKIHFADLGTGSACLAVTLCAERPNWQGIALDRFPRTLNIAKRNIRRYALGKHLLAVLGDFFQPCFLPESLDLVISNPPYVSLAEYKELSPEVIDFEPISALVPAFIDDGGRGKEERHLKSEGEEAELALGHLQAVAKAAALALRPGGVLLLEHGWQQDQDIALLLKSHKWENIEHFQDLAGINRVVAARRSVA